MTYADAIAEYNESPYKGALITRNAKLRKGEEFGFMNCGMELAPHKMSGYNTCRNATGGDGKSIGCADVCVMLTQGFQVMPNAKKAKIGRTKLFFEHREVFADRLARNLISWQKKAVKRGLRLNVRLNAASDLDWERVKMYDGKTVFERFSEIAFYDYTKNFERMVRFANGELPDNYHLTFSRSGENDFLCRKVLSLGASVAVVFGEKLPETFWGHEVIDGDVTDSRYEDRPGLIVGLIEKGKKGASDNGFVYMGHLDQEDDIAVNEMHLLPVLQ